MIFVKVERKIRYESTEQFGLNEKGEFVYRIRKGTDTPFWKKNEDALFHFFGFHPSEALKNELLHQLNHKENIAEIEEVHIEPIVFYVFAIREIEDVYDFNEGKQIREVTITKKNYWEENGCVQDFHLEEDVFLDQVFDDLDLDEVMESTCTTTKSKEEVEQYLNNHPSFIVDPTFQKFIGSIS